MPHIFGVRDDRQLSLQSQREDDLERLNYDLKTCHHCENDEERSHPFRTFPCEQAVIEHALEGRTDHGHKVRRGKDENCENESRLRPQKLPFRKFPYAFPLPSWLKTLSRFQKQRDARERAVELLH